MKRYIWTRNAGFFVAIALFIALTAIPTYAVLDDAYAYYSMDVDGADDSGNGHDGTPAGATHITAGMKLGAGAYSFDGSADNITLYNSSGFVSSSDFSFGGWFLVDSVAADMIMISKADAGYPNSDFLLQQCGGGPYLCVFIYDDTGSETQVYEHGFSTATWYHIVATVDVGTKIILYVNGVNVDNETITKTMNVDALPILLGERSDGYGDFSGDMDEVFFYNKLLTPAEVQSLYNSGTGYNPYAGGGGTAYASVNVTNLVNGSPIIGYTVYIGTDSNTTGANGVAIVFNPTGLNYTFDGNGAYYDVSGTAIENTTTDITTFQAWLEIDAEQLFTSNSISTFNVTNNQAFNTTSSGSLLIPANTGQNEISTIVAGNFTELTNCTAGILNITTCTVIGIHDNEYYFNATDIWNDEKIYNFTLTVFNNTLGGQLYNETTTDGDILFELLQGYTYFFNFTNPGGQYEYTNATLAANASSQTYQFEVLPAPSIDITIRDADDNSLITENITIQLINNATGTTNYTTSGGFFYQDITPGTYTIKLGNANYSQSTYTVTATAGHVYYLTAYLQFAPETVIMQFVDSISTSVVLPGVAVSQERIVNGNWQVISSKVTDITGRTSFRYADDIAYRFTAIITGYDTKQFTLDPILFDSYQIKMVRDTALNFDQDFQSVYVGYKPNIFYNNQQNQMNITFASPLGTFTSYSYFLNYPGGSKTGSGTNSVGESFTIDFNITGAQYLDTVNITLSYDTSIGNPKNFTYSNGIILDAGNTTFIANQDNTYGLGLLDRLIIGTIIIVVVAGLITIGAGPLWGVGIGLFLMGVWIKLGFWPWWAAGLSFLVGFALLAGRSD